MSATDLASQIPASIDRSTLLSLVDASRAINDDLDVPDMFDRIAKQAADVLRGEGASVLLLDERTSELYFVTATGPAGKSLAGARMSADEGIAGQVIRTRRPVRVDDVDQNRNFFSGMDAKAQFQTRSLMAAPLIHRDAVLGVVEVINPIERPCFSDHDLSLLQVFANLAAAATRNAQNLDRAHRENKGLRTAMPHAQIVGQSAPMNEVLRLCKKVAGAPTTVLVTGETGTGKELTARAIHGFSPRKDKPFIAVNCAALPESLLESELFGHEKGAFTGAAERKLGRFELADGGTLFLDEVGEISPSSQTKLLRVLQEQEFTRIGGTKTITCDVRVIAATNRNLKAEVESGGFREDLFYRLNIFPIHMPPLRDRLEDVPHLTEHFIQTVAPKLGVEPPKVSDRALAAMSRYHWPGNIRELRNIIERCTLLAEQDISAADLPSEIASAGDAAGLALESTGGDGAPASKLATQERVLLLEALAETRWNQSAAARKLGISRDHLRYRIKKYKLQKPS